MKRTKISAVSYVALLILATFQILPAFSQATTLVYAFPGDKPVKYVKKQIINQTMDVNGQEMLVNVDSYMDFSIKSAGQGDKNLTLEFRVDSMAQTVDSPQGRTGGNVSEAAGKVFNMVVTPTGRQVDNSGAKAIIVNIDGTGQSNLSQSFNGILPVMPAGKVTPGASWPSSDTIHYDTETNSLHQLVKSRNTFVGFEDYKGTRCAKIMSDLDGKWLMKNQSQGMEMAITGDFTGTSEVLFAPGKGYFLKQDVNLRMKGSIDMPSMGVVFPIVMDIHSSSEAR